MQIVPPPIPPFASVLLFFFAGLKNKRNKETKNVSIVRGRLVAILVTADDNVNRQCEHSREMDSLQTQSFLIIASVAIR